jgi:hypothetical protein
MFRTDRVREKVDIYLREWGGRIPIHKCFLFLKIQYSAGSQLRQLEHKTILDLSPLGDRTIADRIERT